MVYIVAQLVLQTIYVLNKEILQFFSLKSAVYYWDQFQINDPPLEFININLKMRGSPTGTISMDLVASIETDLESFQFIWSHPSHELTKLVIL